MWLSLFCLALFLAIAYFQTIQGVFSAMIMFVLTCLSLAIAFNTYEYVATQWLMSWLPDLALPVAFIGAFVVPLIITRAIFDSLVRRMVMIPMIADKIGGAVFGIFTGLIITGVLLLGLQMIPMGGSFLGYSRVAQVLDVKASDEQDPQEISKRIQNEENKIAKLGKYEREDELWLTPDRFAVRFANLLSEGAFSGERSYQKVHPDLVRSLGWMQATEQDTLHFAPPGSVNVLDMRRVDYVYDRVDPLNLGPGEKPKYEPVQPSGGNSYYAVRIAITTEARDRDGKRRFQLRQIELVGADPTRGNKLSSHYPIAVADAIDPEKHVHVIVTPGRYGKEIKKPAADMVYQLDDGKDSIEVVFELPEAPAKFQPQYLVYKMGARAAVKFPTREGAAAGAVASGAETRAPQRPGGDAVEPSGGGSSGASASGSSGSGRSKPAGRISGARVIVQGTHFGDDFPVILTAYQGYDEEVGSAQALVQGHLVASIADQGEKDQGKPVSHFKVPTDKRLLQFNVENLRARSSLGRAVSQTVKTLQNFRIFDAKGATYTPVGRFAVADMDGLEQVEIMYFPEYAASGARAIAPFKKIRDRDMAGDNYKLVYLFLVEPGAEIVEFRTGTSATPAEDLRPLHLVAPY